VAVPMTAAQWRTQMRKFGVTFKEYSGWNGRGRPGAFSPVGLTIHHTGSDGGQNSESYDNFLFVRGRPEDGIPGPLCQSACEMDGDIILGATGKANHAGSGAQGTLTLVRNDAAPLNGEIRPGADSINGNTWYYGLEVKFDGGQPMTTKAYNAAVRWAAAICDFYGWSGQSVIAHREHSRRKGDPGNTPMDTFRRDVNYVIKTVNAGNPPPVPQDPQGELTVADITTILNKLDALHEVATGRYIQEVEEARAQSKAALAALDQALDEITALRAQLTAEEAEEDRFEALTGDRWAQAVREGREQAAAVLAKLDVIDEQVESGTGGGDVPKA
jgi:flagellin-like hook-associated protein FlgL